MMPGSTWSKGGFVGLIVLISLVIWGVISYFGPQYGIDTRENKAMALAVVWVILLVVHYTPFMFRLMREKYHRWQEQKNKALPGDEGRIGQTAPAMSP